MSAHNDHEDVTPPRRLRVELAPARDLWPGIEARIVKRRQRRLRPWFGYAAAASLVGAVALGVWHDAPPPGPAASVPVAVSPAAAAGRVQPQQRALLKANLAIVRDAENQLQHALEQDPQSESLRRLLASMQQQRSQLRAQLARSERERST